LNILALRFNDGSVNLIETPAPTLTAGCVRVRTVYSALSPGTEGGKISTGKQSLLGKAKARPDQVRMVLDMARSMGIKETINKVRSKLEGAQPLGYSLAGVVTEVGEGITDLQPGDLVACGGGGYANHADEVVVPRNLVVKVPEGVGADAAAMTTLGAIAMQGVRLAEPTLGEHAVVIGQGVVGLLASQLLKANGCRVFGADIAPAALDLALKSGSVDAVGRLGEEPVEEAIESFTRGMGADLVLICAATSSNDPVQLAGRIARKRGRVVVVGAVGMDLPRPDYYTKELAFSVSCSYGPGRYDPSYEEGGLDYPHGFVRWTEGRNMEAFLDLAALGKIDPTSVVTHQLPFAEAPAAYEMVHARSEAFGGILLKYPEQESAPVREVVLRESKPVGDGQIGVGCIGAGSFAQSFLLPPLAKQSGVTLTAISTRTGLTAVDAGQRFGFAKAMDDADAVLADPDTSAVFVATRHDQHGPLVLAALDKGTHVFVEKPLCLTEADLKAIAARATAMQAEGNLPVVQTGFNRRFSAAAAKVRAHFGQDHGPLTMMYRVAAGVIPPDHWIQDPTTGGGRILGEVCHFIDLMQYVCGADPVSVHAAAIAGDNPTAMPEDDVLITLRFADGSVGTVGYFAHAAKSVAKERLEVSGAGRTAVLDNFAAVELMDAKGRKRVRCPGKGQAEEVAAFIEAIRQGQPALSLESQLATTLATLRALDSLRSGAVEPIKIQEL